MHEIFAQRQARNVAIHARRIRFTRVVRARQQIERSCVALNRLETEAQRINRAQVEILRRVVLKIAAAKRKPAKRCCGRSARRREHRRP